MTHPLEPTPEQRAEFRRREGLDEPPPPSSDDDASPRRKQADVLIELAEPAKLFHAADGTAWADITIDSHRETWPLASKSFRRWLIRQYYEQENSAPGAEPLRSAIEVLQARAQFRSPAGETCMRVAGNGDKIYLDLADDRWRVVEIDASGWRLISDRPPVRFRRAAGMLPLPEPQRGGSLAELHALLNVSSSDWVLIISWLLATYRPTGPYPALGISGEQGAAKSTCSEILRGLIDPNKAPLRTLPREDRDLFIAASNSYLLAFDNVSRLTPWIADTFCRLATGGGFATRTLYSDQDETLFDAMRPVLLNGIEDIITRPDLADRTVFITLAPIPESSRRSAATIWQQFEDARPRILGALLNVVAHGLRELPRVRIDQLPRMADFALWAAACEGAYGTPGTFMRAYTRNRNEAVQTVIEADAVAMAICSMMESRTEWTGTSAKLRVTLGEVAGETVIRHPDWPQTPEKVRGRVRRVAPGLRRIGIVVTFGGAGRDRRNITIARLSSGAGIEPSQPSQPSQPNKVNGLNGDGCRSLPSPTVTPTITRAGSGDGQPSRRAETVTRKPLIFQGCDDCDGCDGFYPTPHEGDRRPNPPALGPPGDSLDDLR